MSHAIAVMPALSPNALIGLDPLRLAHAGFLARYKGRTFEAYKTDLEHFFAWCQRNGLPPLQATRPHLELYLRAMETDGFVRHGAHHHYSSATINRRFNTVALFYKYALRDEIIAKDPAAWVDRPAIDREAQRRTFLSPLQHGVFIAQAQSMGVMPYALACLLGLRGLRITSACSLDVTDVHQQHGYDVVEFIAKGGKRVRQALPVPAMRAVRAAIGDRSEGPLLLNCHGRRMARGSATRLIREIAAAARVDTDISPHSLRRSFITTGFASGIPARDMQLAAGHAQINTTMIYDRRSDNPDRDAAHRVSSYLAGFAG